MAKPSRILPPMNWRAWIRLACMLLCAVLALQVWFALRIASMNLIAPQSTTFQRSEILRITFGERPMNWRQEWVDDSRIATAMRRAVIASEDATFAEHDGVDWDAIEKAWERNQAAQARAEKQSERQGKKGQPAKPVAAKIRGGSTITQQLAKNLFLHAERSSLRKAQELAITFMLEGLLSKPRILEIYLNNVEWGEGVFGVEAASQRYFKKPAAQLSSAQAAQLAVMLPAPKRFEKQPQSGYILSRSALIQGRMNDVELPE